MGEPKDSQLVMFCHDLKQLPQLEPTDDWTLRSYEAGDSARWEYIIDRVFGYDSSFAAEMEADAAFFPERVLFICRGEDALATAAAWRRRQWPIHVGYLHMVGVLPKYQGSGLGGQVSLAALHQMRDEGCTGAVLHTDDYRLPAIRTYLKLAFKPYITHQDHAERWQRVLRALADYDSSRPVPGLEV